MLKNLLLAGAILCALTINAEARQRRSLAVGCVETGSVMFPVCGMGQRTQSDREGRRVARGEAVARAVGIGAVRVKRVATQRSEFVTQRLGRETAATGSGIVRSVSGATAHVAASATGAFQCFVDRLDAQGYPVRFLGGWRAHGSVRGSLHPAGLAMDVNQVARNVTTPRMPGNEIALASGCGLLSGASWRSGDSGHVQVGGWAGGGRHYASRHHRHYASAAR